jgi:short-chain Z-isoprenyl diphosphate synthase
VGLRDLAYGAYERRLARQLPADRIPRHVGVILDGNRRWAREFGATATAGHQAGSDRVDELLRWCEDAGVEVVTLWLLSTDNLARSGDELDSLLRIIDETAKRVARPTPDRPSRRVHVVGALDMLPDWLATSLKEVAAATADNDGMLVNVAVGYGGRREITDAVRSLLSEHAGKGTSLDELAEALTVEHIAEHLYTRGQPDPDLVIRTSGEQRLSGFLLWQSAHSEFYFCEAYWPDFRRVDLLRALRAYAARQRRFGG